MTEETEKFTKEQAEGFVQAHMTKQGIKGTFEVEDDPIPYAGGTYKATITPTDKAPVRYFVFSSGSVIARSA